MTLDQCVAELAAISKSDAAVADAVSRAKITVEGCLAAHKASLGEIRKAFGDHLDSDSPIGAAIIKWMDDRILGA